MEVFAIFAFVIFPICVILFFRCTRFLLNPYKLIFIFAKKGSGKSTLLAKEAIRHLNKGWNVFTTENIPGTYQFSHEDIGYKEFPARSVLFIDEASLAWDNRQFKNMKSEVIEWFRLQRHRKIKVYLFSQTFDVDKKIRDQADSMFLLNRVLRVFVYGKRILRIDDIIEAQGDSESRVVHQLKFDSLFFFWAGSRTLTYIPKYIGLFDSYQARPLELKEYPLIPLSQFLSKSRKGKYKVKSPVGLKAILRRFYAVCRARVLHTQPKSL